MKKLLAVACVAMMMAACSGGKTDTTAPDADSATVSVEGAMTVDSLLAYADSLVGQEVTFTGAVSHLCKHAGKKMFIKGTADSVLIRVEACELDSFPKSVIGQTVVVTGKVVETRIDEQYLADWEARINDVNSAEANASGTCETERTARGEKSGEAAQRIADYRARIAEQVKGGGNPWLSFYHIDIISYDIVK